MRPYICLQLLLLLGSAERCLAQYSVPYKSGNAANAAGIATAAVQLQQALSGRPLRCALINSLQLSAEVLGLDGFAFLDSTTGTAAKALLAAPGDEEFATPINRTEITGAFPWVLDWISSQARESTTFYNKLYINFFYETHKKNIFCNLQLNTAIDLNLGDGRESWSPRNLPPSTPG